jgi:hypothetical protein
MGHRDDGGSAFPLAFETSDGYSTKVHANKGMSLRDHFAGQALMGLAAFDRPMGGDNRPEHFARWSYALADAMLAERNKES